MKKQEASTCPNLAPTFNDYTIQPTQNLEPIFCEWLGRTIATYSFLEKTLWRANCVFAALVPVDTRDSEIEQLALDYLEKITSSVSGNLGNQINTFANFIKKFEPELIVKPVNLVTQLNAAVPIRNALCHGAWEGEPDSSGAINCTYVDRKLGILKNNFDTIFLKRTQKEIWLLAVDVIDLVETNGLNFPGKEQ